MFPQYFAAMIQCAIMAHTTHNLRDAVRKFDGKTPFYIHPIGMAMSILNDGGVDFRLRSHAAVVALLHDVLEDTSMTENDIRAVHATNADGVDIDIDLVLQTVRSLTADSSAISQAKFMADPDKASDIEVLVRAADIMDNIVTFRPAQAHTKIPYMGSLFDRLPMNSVNANQMLGLIVRIGHIKHPKSDA